MAAVPEEVLREILLRLPVKSLVRFRCVSKHWSRVIRSQEVIERYSSSNQNKKDNIIVQRCCLYDGRIVLSCHASESFSVVSPELELISPDMQLEHFSGSHNGLVWTTNYYGGTLVCNPALHEIKLIPPCLFDIPKGYGKLCDASRFGFDRVTNSYKIFNLVEFFFDTFNPNANPILNPRFHRVQLYDFKHESWREINANADALKYLHLHGSRPGWELYFNGCWHWVALNVAKGHNDILCFDLTPETFECLEFPNEFASITDTLSFQALLVLRQCLAVVLYDRWQGMGDGKVEIRVMKDYGVKESWAKEYVLGPMLMERPLSFVNDEKLLFHNKESKVVSCTLESG